MKNMHSCETCGKPVLDTERLVFAMPGVPMSVGLCRECFEKDAYPLVIVEGMIEMNGGPERTAEWFLDLFTWVEGKGYVQARDL